MIRAVLYSLVACVAVAMAAACNKSPTPGAEKTPAAKPTPAAEKAPEAKVDKEALFRLVEQGQRDCFIDYNVDKYMATWTDDVRLVGGRGPEPGPHDLALNRAQIEATKRLRYGHKSEGPGFTLTFDNPQVEVSGDTAELRWRATFRVEDFEEVTDELYKLRKTPQGWRAFENRYWTITSGQAGRAPVKDAAFWAAQDARVKSAKEAGDGFAEAQALMDANRFADAHQRLTSLPQEKQASEAWALRATAAVIVGNVADAKKSACRARAIQADVQLPAWARKLSCP